jgi:methylmalonyl-CoA mutase C-terminal domain/subunit
MNTGKLKILLAKPGLDGHDVGVKVLAHALIDAGFEVVYTGLRKSIEDIVQKAADNKVDLIGLSILSGTHREICRQMNAELKRRGLSVPWIVGGNIPNEDIPELVEIGALAAFPTGTTIETVIEFCRQFAEKASKP